MGVWLHVSSYSMDGKKLYTWKFPSEHEFYEAMRNGSMPTTAQVNLKMQKTAGALPERRKRYSSYCIFSALSGTYNSSRIAAEELMEDYPTRKIIVADSLGASLGQGVWFTLHRRRKSREKIWRQLVKWEENRLHMVHLYSQRFKPPILRRPHFQNYCSSSGKHAEY